jgi:aspartokinase
VVSLIGEGIVARPDLLGEAMTVLEKAGIEPKSCRTASLAVSFVIDGPKAPDAVRLLHERFIEAK